MSSGQGKLIFPEITVTPLQDLDESYNLVTSSFEAAGLQVYRPDYLNSIINAREFSRVFNVYHEEIKHTFFIFTGQLDEEKINQVLNSFTQPGDKSKVYFLSAYPLPGILSFIGKNSPAAFFELEVIRNLKNIDEIAADPARLMQNSDLLNNLSKKYFDLEISYDVPQSIKNLEKAIINFFRNGEDYETIEEFSVDYFPYYSLVLFGLYMGDLLARNFRGELFYKAGQDIKKLGIGFSMEDNDFIEMLAHPVDKVFSFFFHGKEASIINWYYELKYILNKRDSQ